jgi:hypothetical protein
MEDLRKDEGTMDDGGFTIYDGRFGPKEKVVSYDNLGVARGRFELPSAFGGYESLSV